MQKGGRVAKECGVGESGGAWRREFPIAGAGSFSGRPRKLGNSSA